MKRAVRRCKMNLSETTEDKLKWYERLGKAFTDEDAAFNFPIKYPAIDLDKATKQTFYLTAGILAGGMILTALIIRAKK
jgi:hypothetical protein